MSSHTAHAEIQGLMRRAGLTPEQVIAFNGELQNALTLAAWLNVSAADRTRILTDQSDIEARTRLNAGGRR